jgi:hypothetical protein
MWQHCRRSAAPKSDSGRDSLQWESADTMPPSARFTRLFAALVAGDLNAVIEKLLKIGAELIATPGAAMAGARYACAARLPTAASAESAGN